MKSSAPGSRLRSNRHLETSVYKKLGIASGVELVLYVVKGREDPPLLASGQSDVRARRESPLILQR
jgi:hypothetical protein